jgi:hypothetical protein
MAGIRASTRWQGASVCTSRAKAAAMVGCGSGTVQRVEPEMATQVARA